MKVSVLLPVYNAAATLADTLESVLAQTFADFEVVAIDDGSSDASPQILRDFAVRDARVRPILNTQNAGLIQRLNEGLREARCDLVARMDADDLCRPRRLELQVRALEGAPDVAVLGTWVHLMGVTPGRDKLVTLPTSPAEVAATLRKDNCIVHPSVMLRRKAVLEAGGYNPRAKHAEDYELWLRMARRHQLANIPEPLLRYRISVSGVTLTRKWEQYTSHCLSQVLAETNWSDDEAELERRVKEKLGQTPRDAFLAAVVKGNVEELLTLGHRGPAARLLWRYRRNLKAAKFWPLAWKIIRAS